MFRLALLKIFLLFEFLVQVAVMRVLQHHVNALVVIEVSVESDYVRVTESPLNLKFFLHLREEVEVLQLLLVYHLECNLLA